MTLEKKRQSLGRGLSSLLGEDVKEQIGLVLVMERGKFPLKILNPAIINHATVWMI